MSKNSSIMMYANADFDVVRTPSRRQLPFLFLANLSASDGYLLFDYTFYVE